LSAEGARVPAGRADDVVRAHGARSVEPAPRSGARPLLPWLPARPERASGAPGAALARRVADRARWAVRGTAQSLAHARAARRGRHGLPRLPRPLRRAGASPRAARPSGVHRPDRRAGPDALQPVLHAPPPELSSPP